MVPLMNPDEIPKVLPLKDSPDGSVSLEIHLLGESAITRTEMALLKHEQIGLLASAQLNYYTNGFKNFVRLERVVVKQKFRGTGYGNMLVSGCIEHIRETPLQFDAQAIGRHLATDSKDAEELWIAASNRGVDRIHLECAESLEEFYQISDMVRSGEIQMEIDLNELDFSSLT